MYKMMKTLVTKATFFSGVSFEKKKFFLFVTDSIIRLLSLDRLRKIQVRILFFKKIYSQFFFVFWSEKQKLTTLKRCSCCEKNKKVCCYFELNTRKKNLWEKIFNNNFFFCVLSFTVSFKVNKDEKYFLCVCFCLISLKCWKCESSKLL